MPCFCELLFICIGQQNDDCFCEGEALLLLWLKSYPLRGLSCWQEGKYMYTWKAKLMGNVVAKKG